MYGRQIIRKFDQFGDMKMKIQKNRQTSTGFCSATTVRISPHWAIRQALSRLLWRHALHFALHRLSK